MIAIRAFKGLFWLRVGLWGSGGFSDPGFFSGSGRQRLFAVSVQRGIRLFRVYSSACCRSEIATADFAAKIGLSQKNWALKRVCDG